MSKLLLVLLLIISAATVKAVHLHPDSLKERGMQFQMNADSAKTAALKSIPDSTRKKKPEPVVYVYNRPLSDNSQFVRDSIFLWRDYKYVADYFNLFPGYFVQSLGTLGQPEELNLYGQGNGEVGIFQDGMGLNNHPNNYFSTYNISSESIDSIELIPLTRAFLFGGDNNVAGINVLSSSRLVRQPYTRIRFYQAADGEGMISVQLHQQAYRKLSVFFEIANRKKDATFGNTAYSSWNMRAALHYPLRDDLTAGIEYTFTKANTDLWGGVNYDSLTKLYSMGAELVMYDFIKAPVTFYELYKKEQSNAVVLKLNSKIIDKQPGEFRLFYRENLNEFRLNENIPGANTAKYNSNLTNSSLGANISQRLTVNPVMLNLLAGTEKVKSNNYAFEKTSASTIAYFTGICSATFLDSALRPAFFVKYLNKGGISYSGTGADFKGQIINGLSVYGGYSWFRQSVFALLNTVHNFELRVDAEIAAQQMSLTYFKTTTETRERLPTVIWANNRVDTISTAYGAENVTGLNLRLRNNYSFVFIDASLNYCRKTEAQTLPEWSGNIGVYYKAIHFDSALRVKAGFDLQLFTKFPGQHYDLFFEHTYASPTGMFVPANYALSFTVVGEIKRTAIVYFTWENLLDNTYYVVPYFPMARRGFRFGLTWDLFN